jgi:hypothetical protein
MEYSTVLDRYLEGFLSPQTPELACFSQIDWLVCNRSEHHARVMESTPYATCHTHAMDDTITPLSVSLDDRKP